MNMSTFNDVEYLNGSIFDIKVKEPYLLIFDTAYALTSIFGSTARHSVISIWLLVGFHPATRSVQSTPADNTRKRV